MTKKVALITGGSRGIGKSTALAFASKGYDVVITYKNNLVEAEKTIKTLTDMGAKAEMIKADFQKTGEPKKMFDKFQEMFSSLNVLVNNAGWTKYISADNLLELDESMFDNIISVHLRASYFNCIFASKLMKGVSSPAIINISSIAAFNGIGSNIAYCAAKAGVVTMTKSLAIALGPEIRVNCVAPGLTNTELTKNAPKSYSQEQIDNTPLKKLAEPEDIADVVFSLASEMKFVNGKTIIVDGGRI